MTDPKNLRDYGLGDHAEPSSTPTWVRAEPIDGHEPICPNCGAWCCEITLQVDHPLLIGGQGTGRYLGCPACPWASPMMMTATQDPT